MEKKKGCLVPGCEQHLHARGLCHRHYFYALHHLKDKGSSWDELVMQGKALPSRKSKENNPAYQFFFGDKS